MNSGRIFFATCSWKYDSWRELIYSQKREINYLEEYAAHYASVEIDQWFWSLFGMDKIVLPESATVAEYVAAVPREFKFSIKAPNSLTLTHFYPKSKKDPLVRNPHFLSVQLFETFIELLTPMRPQIGQIMFQFEYLNQRKMSSLQAFIKRFSEFAEAIEPGLNYAIEIRNPNYLKPAYFDFLKKMNLAHVFLEGYYMPAVFEIYQKFKPNFSENVVIRLHGPSRADIEKLSGGIWNRILDPHDADLKNIVKMLQELVKAGHKIYMNVNNHYEGSAPLTIKRLQKFMQAGF